MNVIIRGAEFPLPPVGSWSFREAAKVVEITSQVAEPDDAGHRAGIRPGDMMDLMLANAPNGHLAFAVVAWMRAGHDPDELLEFAIDDAVADWFERQPEQKEGEPDSPPAASDDADESDRHVVATPPPPPS